MVNVRKVDWFVLLIKLNNTSIAPYFICILILIPALNVSPISPVLLQFNIARVLLFTLFVYIYWELCVLSTGGPFNLISYPSNNVVFPLVRHSALKAGPFAFNSLVLRQLGLLGKYIVVSTLLLQRVNGLQNTNYTSKTFQIDEFQILYLIIQYRICV